MSGLSRKTFWESLAAQTISGLIILAVATFLARATGFVSAQQGMIFLVGIGGFVLIFLLAFGVYRSFSTVHTVIDSWTSRRFPGRHWPSHLIFTGYKIVSSGAVLALLFGLAVSTDSVAEILRKHPDKTLVVYSAGLDFPDRPQPGDSPGVGCHRKVIMLSNQTGDSIVFTGAEAVISLDSFGNGLVDTQDLNWMPIGTADAQASTGAMTLGPYQAALVSFASTDARVTENMRLKSASPLVEVRQMDELSFLTPSLVHSAEALNTVACHEPVQIKKEIPSGYQLFEQLYPNHGR